MSKAFTNEDALSEDESFLPYVAPWPEGAKNYISQAGFDRLCRERDQFVAEKRKNVASEGTDSAANAAREIARRLYALNRHLEAAEIVAPPLPPYDEVRFGTQATVEDEHGRRRHYAIVGVDETDAPRGRVSCFSPVARALLGKRVGDVLTLRSPRGDEELAITAIEAAGKERETLKKATTDRKATVLFRAGGVGLRPYPAGPIAGELMAAWAARAYQLASQPLVARGERIVHVPCGSLDGGDQHRAPFGPTGGSSADNAEDTSQKLAQSVSGLSLSLPCADSDNSANCRSRLQQVAFETDGFKRNLL